MDENFLKKKLESRRSEDGFRSLRIAGEAQDYCSNDYLGIVQQGQIEKAISGKRFASGATGSRLLAGNYPLIEETEKQIAVFHQSAAALIFNSGYDANFGLLSCVAVKGDIILYDKLSHASIRDGIRQSFAASLSFAHNDVRELEHKLKGFSISSGTCFVVTESVFSMDGDLAPLNEMADLCDKYGAKFIVDEAHATGVIGASGEGLVQLLALQHRCFARVHTFGKALGCHGAVVLGSETLRDFLINFCRPFIYSTALPPSAVAAIRSAYEIFPGMHAERKNISDLIELFDPAVFRKSHTPIQCCIVPGNEQVKNLSRSLLREKLDVRAILHPTVPKGEERLRITLHGFNSIEQTKKLISLILGSAVKAI